MWRISENVVHRIACHHNYAGRTVPAVQTLRLKSTESVKPDVTVPSSADVVIIGGGSAGCHTLYHLAKRGVKGVLLERAQLTAGTTWHTAGLVWRLRPNDVDIQLLANSRNMLMQLEQESGLDPGWIQNGGVFIAHSEVGHRRIFLNSIVVNYLQCDKKYFKIIGFCLVFKIPD